MSGMTIGEALELDVSLTAHGDARLLIDYLLELPGARGPKPPKVFKLKSLRLAQDETLEIGKRHPLRGDATTYSLHPGPARVTLQINGQPGPSCAFTLAAGD